MPVFFGLTKGTIIGLIAGRIWWIQRSSLPYRNSTDVNKDPVSRALVIIIESGMPPPSCAFVGLAHFFFSKASIYVGWLIALVATEITASNVYFMIFAFVRCLSSLPPSCTYSLLLRFRPLWYVFLLDAKVG